MTTRPADHACRYCLGQLVELVSDKPDGRSVFECTACGLHAHGEPDNICGCGILAKPVLATSGPRFRCIANPTRTPARPAPIVITFDEAAAA